MWRRIKPRAKCELIRELGVKWRVLRMEMLELSGFKCAEGLQVATGHQENAEKAPVQLGAPRRSNYHIMAKEKTFAIMNLCEDPLIFPVKFETPQNARGLVRLQGQASTKT